MAASAASSGGNSAAGAKLPKRKERTAVCSYCNMSFNKKEHLQRHERTHTLARPYVCEYPDCGKTFARRDTLTRHTRLHQRDQTILGGSPVPGISGAEEDEEAETVNPAEQAVPTRVKRSFKKTRDRSSSTGKKTAASISDSEPSLSHTTSSAGSGHSGPLSGSSLEEEKPECYLPLPAQADVSMSTIQEPSIVKPERSPEQATPVSFTTASLLYDYVRNPGGQLTHPSTMESAPANSTLSSTFSLADGHPAGQASALGLDLGIPMEMGNYNNSYAQNSDLSNFSGPVQEGFRLPPDATQQIQNFQDSAVVSFANGHSQQHQLELQQRDRDTSAVTAAAASVHLQQQTRTPNQPNVGNQQQSFLTSGASSSCSPELFKFNEMSPLPVLQVPMHSPPHVRFHSLPNFGLLMDRSFSPVEEIHRPATSTSDATNSFFPALTYRSSPVSDASSLPAPVVASAMSASAPAVFSELPAYESFYYGDTDMTAFKHHEVYLQPITMAENLSLEITSEPVPSLADQQADEFIQWPPREDSPPLPAVGALTPDNTLTSVSSNSPSTSSFLDLGDYDQPNLLVEKTVADASYGAHSPIASLEEWLVRHPSDGLYD